MMNPPVYSRPYAIEQALQRQARSHYQLSVHIPGGRWVTYEGNGSYAVRINNDTTDNVVFIGTANQIAQRYGKQAPRVAPATHQEYQSFVAADDAWQAELERLFGRNAGDVRYTERSHTGPTLAPLYAEFCRARDVWEATREEARNNA